VKSAINMELLKISLNPIAELMDDQDVTDILVCGSKRVSVKRRGGKFEDFSAEWRSDADLMVLAESIAREMNRDLDEREPILDARLPDKSRVSIIRDPCYNRGALIVIRRFPEQRFTLNDLLNFGALDQSGLTILEIIMRYGRNVLIAGGTGSGKTTLLNSLCGFIPPHEVVVTVEDAREISVPCKLWQALESKRAEDKNDRDINLGELVRASLRINPTWIIVGEVRDEEAIELVRAFNTGHHGAGTIHANSAYDALEALEILSLPSRLPHLAIKGLVSRTIHIVVHMGVLPDQSRRIMEIIEVEGLDYDRSAENPPYKTRTLYEFEFDHYDADGKAHGRFVVKEPPTWVNKLKLIPNFQMPDFWK